MLSREGLAFFHRILFFVSKLKLHPFTVRSNLLIVAESKRTHLIGWASIFLNILHLPLVIRLIKETGKIEGIIHSLLITVLVGSNTVKLTILLYHSELVQVANNVVVLSRKLGKNTFEEVFVWDYFSKRFDDKILCKIKPGVA